MKSREESFEEASLKIICCCSVSPCILECRMNAHRQFFAFTYRYWHSIAALADVHI